VACDGWVERAGRVGEERVEQATAERAAGLAEGEGEGEREREVSGTVGKRAGPWTDVEDEDRRVPGHGLGVSVGCKGRVVRREELLPAGGCSSPPLDRRQLVRPPLLAPSVRESTPSGNDSPPYPSRAIGTTIRRRPPCVHTDPPLPCRSQPGQASSRGDLPGRRRPNPLLTRRRRRAPRRAPRRRRRGTCPRGSSRAGASAARERKKR